MPNRMERIKAFLGIPVKRDFLTVQEPLARTDVVHPGDGNQQIFLRGVVRKRFFDFGNHGFIRNTLGTRHEQRRAGAGECFQPDAVLLPRDSGGDTDTVSICHVERAVLHHAEGKRVDTHLAGTVPVTTGGIITRAVDLNQSCAQMRERVAADDDRSPAASRIAV